MNLLLKKHFRKMMALLFVIFQLFQPLSQVSAVAMTTPTEGVHLVSAKQTSSDSLTLDLTVTNTSSSLRQDQLVLSEGLQALEVTGGKLLDPITQAELANYSLSAQTLTIETQPNVATTALTFDLKLSKFDATLENSLTLGTEVTKVEPLMAETVESPSSSTEGSSSSSSSLAPVPSSSSWSSSPTSSLKPKSFASLVGNDITQYLPAGNNGTIITGATWSFTDSKGNPVAEDQVKQDTNLNFDYKWAIPNNLFDSEGNPYNIKAGDFFSFKLPTGITYKPGTGSLGDYANYSITSDGTVTFTFNDLTESHDTISGDFNYTSTVKSSGPGTVNIVIDTTGTPVTIPITVIPTGGAPISKAGSLTGANTSGNNPTGITWDIIINTNGQKLINAKVSDPMPKDTTGQVSTSFKTVAVYPLTIDFSGNVTSTGQPLIEGTDYSVDSNDGTVTFIGNYANTAQAFMIEYTSDIDSSTVPDAGGQVSFTNTATLTSDGKDKATATATVPANFGELLNKSFDGADASGSQKYNWHVDYNYGEKNLPAGSQLMDTLSSGQVFSGTPALVYEDGTKVGTSLYTVSYSSDNTQMTVTFPQGLSQGVKISYQSQVIAPIDDSGLKLDNSVSSNGKAVTSNGNLVGSQGLTKTRGSVDYNAKTVKWNFVINTARQDMTNWSMVDTVPSGLTVDYNSFVFKDADTGVTLSANGADPDYAIIKNGAGFTISFIGNLSAHAKDKYTLEYTTTFEANTFKGDANGKWTNAASATWTDQTGGTHTNNGQADFQPKPEFKNDGSKSGSYNAVTKQITWTVVGNYNQRTLQSASIVDQIIGDQNYVADSAKLYEATITTDGTAKIGNQVTNAEITFDDSTHTLTAKLPEGSAKAYILTYQTSLANLIIDQPTYNNTATYSNNNISSSLTASVTVPSSGNVVEKTGLQDPNNSAYALWNIWVNKAQSTITNAVITDNPSGNQIIDKSSIVIYPTTVASNGTFAEDTANPLTDKTDYTVDLQTDNVTGKQVLTIKFTGDYTTITTAYSIHYRALINSSSTSDTLTNTASISGTGQKDVTGDNTGSTVVTNNGGSSTGKNTNIVLTKTDQDSKKALAGAKFELWSDVSGKAVQLLRDATTDINGQLNWQNLKSGKYILKEISAPAGYVISSTLANGQEINVLYNGASPINGAIIADADNNVQVAITNQKGKITIYKTDGDTNQPLADAKFDLYQKNVDGDKKIAADLRSGSDGKISYSGANGEGLDAGDYYVIETSTPDGYIVDNTTKYSVTIDGSQIQPTVTVKNSEITGSISLTKTDGDKPTEFVKGAQYEVYNQSNNKVATRTAGNLITDAKGYLEAKGLKPGKYYFKEIMAPAGYDLNPTTYLFTIALQTANVVEQNVPVSDAEKTGSVTLTKTDSDTKSILPDAIFTLYKSDNTVVKSNLVTDSNGQIKYDGLKPGDYYFMETAAPDGYLFDDNQHYDFTIALQTPAAIANPATVAATNAETTGSVTLTKTESDTKSILPGAIFTLYKSDNTVVKSNLVTDSNGQIKYDGLKPGDYYFMETAAPDGYNFDTAQHYDFTIALQTLEAIANPATVTVTNAEKTGTVILMKSDSDTGKSLKGVTFKLYKEDGNEVTRDAAFVTDKEGKITVDQLKPGQYYFMETAAPAGYDFDATKHYDFEVLLQVSGVKQATVEIGNAETKGSVILTKTDSDTGIVLAGATFKLYQADGTEVTTKTPLVTDDKGEISVGDLTPGDYYFVESKAPAGYVLDNTKRTFTVAFQDQASVATATASNAEKTGSVVLTKEDGDTGKVLAGASFSLYKKDGTLLQSDLQSNDKGQITVTDLKPGDYYFMETAAPAGYLFDSESHYDFTIELQTTTKTPELTVKNAEKTGAVVLTKEDSDTGKVLAGATFKLYQADGTEIKTAEALVTDDKGQINYDGLKPGDYYFVETKAPLGYELDQSKLAFAVKLQTTKLDASVKAENAETKGAVTLTKVDGASGQKLASAHFSLFDQNGQLLQANLVTGNDGTLTVKDLTPGKYYFQETAAPKGYDFDATKHYDFEIEFQSTTKLALLTVTNTASLPAAGDSSALPMALTGSAFIGLALLVMRKSRKKKA